MAPKGGRICPRAMSMRSPVTAEAVAAPPAPRPTNTTSPTKSPLTATQFKYAVDLGDRGVLRHHGRMHALLDAAVGPQRDAEQLDAVAELVGRLDVGRRDLLDALDIDGLEAHARAKGKAREQGKLMRGVEAADVEGRIGLGVTLRLRLLEHLGKTPPLTFHPRQDVIAGAVEDAVDAGDVVALQALAHRLDDGDAPGDRGLEIQRHAVLLGERGEARTVMGKQRLVGGDDMLAGAQRSFDGVFRHARPRRPSIRRRHRCRDRSPAPPGLARAGTPRCRRPCSGDARASTRPRPRSVCPARAARESPRAARSCNSPPPTVPTPASPSFNASAMEGIRTTDSPSTQWE